MSTSTLCWEMCHPFGLASGKCWVKWWVNFHQGMQLLICLLGMVHRRRYMWDLLVASDNQLTVAHDFALEPMIAIEQDRQNFGRLGRERPTKDRDCPFAKHHGGRRQAKSRVSASLTTRGSLVPGPVAWATLRFANWRSIKAAQTFWTKIGVLRQHSGQCFLNKLNLRHQRAVNIQRKREDCSRTA